MLISVGFSGTLPPTVIASRRIGFLLAASLGRTAGSGMLIVGDPREGSVAPSGFQ